MTKPFCPTEALRRHAIERLDALADDAWRPVGSLFAEVIEGVQRARELRGLPRFELPEPRT